MNPTIYLFILFELIMVTIGDLKYRKIRNAWVLLNLFVASLFFIFFPTAYPLNFETFVFTIVFIIVGFILFQFKIMGGGDSKFLASFFLLIPLTHQETFFYFLLLSTIVVGVILFFRNILLNFKELVLSIKTQDLQGVKNCFGTKFAYAPVILITWIYLGFHLYSN